MKSSPQYRLFCVILIVFTLLLPGCSGYQYVASPRYVPLNEEKGELTVNVHPCALQVGYAFANNVSVFATGFNRIPSVETRDSWSGSHRYGDSREFNAGLSYFGKAGNFVIEVLAGGGYGEMSYGNDFHRSSHQYKFDMTADRRNLFIQPDIRYKFGSGQFSKHLSLAVFAKFNDIRYYNIQSEYEGGLTWMVDDGVHYFLNRSEADLFFIEPGVQIKGGFRNFKLLAQISRIINAGEHSLYYQYISLNFGVTMNLNLLAKHAEK